MARIVPMRLHIPRSVPVPPLGDYYDYGASAPRDALLASAWQDVSGGLIDFERLIREAATVQEALALHLELSSLEQRIAALVDKALHRADALGNGNAA